MVEKTALVTGVTGQDGSYLSELLLSKGYEVHGIVRRTSSLSRERLDDMRGGSLVSERSPILHYGELTDASTLTRIVLDVQPDEIYNLASQSHVRVSFDSPAYTLEVNALGTLHLLEAARILHQHKKVKFYQASSSELFGGDPATAPQSEETPFHPRSPYACSKACAHFQAVHYREAHGIFTCCGILFNHESPRRGENFVTRKVTLAAARIHLGLQEKLFLGNLDGQRDWGYAKDYVEAMWRMMQQDTPDDYVIATGKTHTVRDLLDTAFTHTGLDWQDHVETDPRFLRPTEGELYVGDTSKAREILGWQPQASFEELVQIMVEADLERVRFKMNQRDPMAGQQGQAA